ncbi:exonuclease I, partial [Achromatium sp. WMS1]
MNTSFYWHDYETWGTDPAKDRPVQFAGLRTNWELQPIGEPLVLYASPADDLLPDPTACLITGITPQFAEIHGVVEAEFINRIHQELAYPGTCGAGYNSLRFDDEVTRYTLFRNFFDPYAREWRNGNSRWDLIDVMRLAQALRPEGINWPTQDGVPSFRLGDLATANNISHAHAHDALSDVRATIGLAQLLRSQQPRLFDYALKLRDKQRVKELLNFAEPRPLLHVSSKYPASLGCIAPILALAPHPTDRNSIIVADLRTAPDLLLNLSVEEIKQRLFTPKQDLPEGIARINLKTIHINRVPMIAPMNTLTSEAAKRWAIDIKQVQTHYHQLQTISGLTTKLSQVFLMADYSLRDPEQDLYGGFINSKDRVLCDAVRATSPQRLQHFAAKFTDPRLAPLLLRYQARNWPETLTTIQRQEWEIYRKRRFTDPENGGGSITLSEYKANIAALRLQHSKQPDML